MARGNVYFLYESPGMGIFFSEQRLHFPRLGSAAAVPVADRLDRGSIETACLYMIPTLHYLILGTLCLYGYRSMGP